MPLQIFPKSVLRSNGIAPRPTLRSLSWWIPSIDWCCEMQRAWPTGSCCWGTSSSSRKRSILTTSRVSAAIEFRLDKNEPNHLAASNTSTAFFRHVIVLQSISDISELSGLAKWLLLLGCGNILHSRILWALTATKDTSTSATHGKSLTNHNSSCKQVDWW